MLSMLFFSIADGITLIFLQTETERASSIHQHSSSKTITYSYIRLTQYKTIKILKKMLVCCDKLGDRGHRFKLPRNGMKCPGKFYIEKVMDTYSIL